MGKEVDVGEVLVSSYSRKQAIDDGVLIDVSEMAREAGFSYPTAVTHTVNVRYVTPAGLCCNEEYGRMINMLWALKQAIVTRDKSECDSPGLGLQDVIKFQMLVRNDNLVVEPVTLKAVCGPGDDGEPVLTIMLPSED